MAVIALLTYPTQLTLIIVDTADIADTADREEQQQLAFKLATIEKKIIVGGVNLLEKAEEQERLLAESAKELEERNKKTEVLRRTLEEKEVGVVYTRTVFHYRPYCAP